MKIHSLTLNNFRVYKGEQSIIFSTDKDKNVTLCLAKNNAGKTTLTQSIYWCLFGELNLSNSKTIWNKEVEYELLEGEECDVFVNLRLNFKKKDYLVERKVVYKKTKARLRKIDESFSIIDLTNTEDVTNSIGAFIPKSLSRFFIFDGERMLHLGQNSKRHKEEVKKDIKNILELDVIDLAIEHIGGKTGNKGVIKSINDRINEYQPKEIQEKRKNHLNILSEIEDLEKDRDEILILIDELKSEEFIVNNKLKELDDSKDQEKRQEKVDELEKLNEKIYKSEKRTFKFFSNRSSDYLLNILIKDAVDFIEDNEELKEVIPDVTSDTINYILEKKECLCGTKFLVDSKEYEYLMNLFKFYPPESIGNLTKKFLEDANRMKNDSDNWKNDLEEKIDDLDELKGEKAVLVDIINEIDRRFSSSKVNEIKDLNKRYNEIKKDIEEKIEYKGRIQSQIDTRQADSQKLEAELDDLQIISERCKKFNQQLQIAKRIDALLKDINKKEAKRVKEDLQNEVQKVYSRINRGEGKLEINEDYDFVIFTKCMDGLVRDNAKGQGLTTVAAFAFVCGLTRLVRNNSEDNSIVHTNEPYPMIIDAPFSNMDKDYIEKVSTILPSYAEQLIILVKDDNFEVAKEKFYSENRVKFEYSIALNVDENNKENQFVSEINLINER